MFWSLKLRRILGEGVGFKMRDASPLSNKLCADLDTVPARCRAARMVRLELACKLMWHSSLHYRTHRLISGVVLKQMQAAEHVLTELRDPHCRRASHFWVPLHTYVSI